MDEYEKLEGEMKKCYEEYMVIYDDDYADTEADADADEDSDVGDEEVL